MAGLLGNLDDPQNMGMLQLAAGLLGTGSFGDQVGRGLQGYQATQMNALAQQKDKMQMDMLRQQVEQATRKNTLINNYLTGLGGGSPSVASTGATAGDAQPSPQPGMFNGVPSSAIGADLALNDGKNIGEWLFKRGVPDMQVSGGYAYDKNNLPPGFLPSVNVSNNGQATMTMPDGKGGVTVSAPQGALDTYGAYQGAEQAAKAKNELVQVSVPGPNNTSKKVFVSKSEVLGQKPTGGFVGDPQQILSSIAGIKDPKERAAALDAFQNQLSGNGGKFAADAPARTEGQTALDQAFSKDYASFSAAGGYSDVVKQLDQLKVAADSLGKNKTATGPVVGHLPESIRAFTNPDAVNTKNLVEESVQRNLRAVLGAQFTENEGSRLIARAYNPLLPPEENQRRVVRLIDQIKTAAEQKAKAAAYFEKNGTLQGWEGKLPSFNDFSPEGKGPAAKSEPRGATGDFSPKTISLADIAATAKASGKTTKEVTEAARAKGYTIGGQ